MDSASLEAQLDVSPLALCDVLKMCPHALSTQGEDMFINIPILLSNEAVYKASENSGINHVTRENVYCLAMVLALHDSPEGRARHKIKTLSLVLYRRHMGLFHGLLREASKLGL